MILELPVLLWVADCHTHCATQDQKNGCSSNNCINDIVFLAIHELESSTIANIECIKHDEHEQILLEDSQTDRLHFLLVFWYQTANAVQS